MSPRARPRDPWPFVLAAAHLAHTLWYASLYPDGVHDPDLLAYFVYFRSWLEGSTALHDTAYFAVPKPLLVFVLGPLGSPAAAFAVSALGAAALGALVYLIGRDVFGRTAGILASALLLLDVDRATLALHASADFFVALFLYASIHAALGRRYVRAGVALALAALVKPVALPCLVHLLAVDGSERRRARIAAAIPLVAVPLTLLANHWLLGSPFAMQRALAGFAAMSDGTPMPAAELIRFVVWVELVKTLFVATAPLGVLGIVVWIGRDRRRLGHPFFLAPLALLGGYVGLAAVTPVVPYARFFWPIQVWFGCFVVFGMLETARHLAPSGRLGWGVAAVLFVFLFDEQMSRQLAYRARFATPFQQAMCLVGDVDGVLATAHATGDSVLAPASLTPYLLWRSDEARRAPSRVRVAELEPATDGKTPPEWVLYVPRAFVRESTRAAVEALLASGLYQPLIAGEDGVGALYVRRDHRARTPTPTPTS
jgi:hypothetical protein